jgi:hypothetical protein
MPNGITSNKAPRKIRRSDRERGHNLNNFRGDPILEVYSGEMGRLAQVQQGAMTGLTSAARDKLLRQAGFRINRND